MTEYSIWIPVYDGNNILRRKFETGAPVSQVIPFHNTNPVFWVFDGRNALQSRRKIFPDYKIKRDRETPTVNGFYEFARTVKAELLPHCRNVTIIEVEGMEADDIIAHLVRTTNNSNSMKGETGAVGIDIISNDGDFYALEALGGVRLEKKPKWADSVAPDDVRLYKTLVGDSSDNIPGLRLFGDKAWLSLKASDRLRWEMWLEGNDQWEVEILPTLGKAQLEWWNNGGRALLRDYWNVVGFLPVDREALAIGTRYGVADVNAYQATMAKYMWV